MLSFLQTFSSSFWSVNCRVGSFSGWNWQKPEESKKRRRRGLFFPTFLRLLWPLVVEPSRRESDLKLNTDRAALCYGNNLETQHRSKNCRFFCGRVHVGAHTHTHTPYAPVVRSNLHWFPNVQFRISIALLAGASVSFSVFLFFLILRAESLPVWCLYGQCNHVLFPSTPTGVREIGQISNERPLHVLPLFLFFIF